MGAAIAGNGVKLARDIAAMRVIEADAAQSLRQATLIMYRHQVRCLVVTDSQDGRRVPVGMLTAGDLSAATRLRGCDADTTTVAGAMSQPLVVCREDHTFAELIIIMRNSGRCRLPVVDAAGTLVGIVSADDVVAAMAESMADLSRALGFDPPPAAPGPEAPAV